MAIVHPAFCEIAQPFAGPPGGSGSGRGPDTKHFKNRVYSDRTPGVLFCR